MVKKSNKMTMMANGGSSRLIWLLGILLVTGITVTAGDWPQFRGGPTNNGVSTDRIVTNWGGANPVWLVSVTNSLCGFSVSGGRAFTQINPRLGDWNTSEAGMTNREVCIALNITDGALLWTRMVESNASYNSVEGPDTGYVGPTDGPRTTPATDGSSVYVLTSYLKLYRLNATNGAIIWQTNLLAGFGGSLPRFKNAASPLLENGFIYVNAGSATASLMAISTTNGTVVWRSQNEGLTHSTPVIATLQGVSQLIFCTTSGLVALNPLTGVKLWKFNLPFTYSSHYSLACSPVVHQDMVFMSGTRSISYSSFVAQVTFTNSNWTNKLLWIKRDPTTTFTTPVARDGFLYGTFGFDTISPYNELKCVDMRTGTVKWSQGGFGRGGLIRVNNNLLVLTETCELVLAEAQTNAYVELGRLQPFPPYDVDYNKSWNVPALADGRVYLRSTSYGAAYDFSIPPLKLDPPQPALPDKFELTVRTANGTPIDSTRASLMEMRSTTNLELSPAIWPKLTNNLFLDTDAGVVRVTNVDAAPPRQFFIISEPK